MMHSEMSDPEFYTFCVLLVFFVLGGIIEGRNNLKLIFLICIVSLIASADVFAGDRKYNNKGAGQSKTSSILEQQRYMNWLQQSCPSFIAPRYNLQSEPRQQQQAERPLPTWGREGVSGITKGRK